MPWEQVLVKHVMCQLCPNSAIIVGRLVYTYQARSQRGARGARAPPTFGFYIVNYIGVPHQLFGGKGHRCSCPTNFKFLPTGLLCNIWRHIQATMLLLLLCIFLERKISGQTIIIRSLLLLTSLFVLLFGHVLVQFHDN